MAEVSIRGKENVLKHFTKINDPYWKLYNSKDTKTPIQTLLSVNNAIKSRQHFADLLESLDTSGTYILDTFTVATSKETGGMKWSKPDTTTCFALNEAVNNPTPLIMGDENKKKTDFIAPNSLRDTIELIRENATLTVELSVYKQKLQDAINRISVLENEVNELNEELEELEEEAEEAEEAVSGNGVPKNLEEALTGLIAQHGGTLIENLMSKGVASDPFKEANKIAETPVNTESSPPEMGEEPEQEIKMNGIGDSTPDLFTIVGELQKFDPLLSKHLYKLLLIARQKPITFKLFLNKLETF